MEKKRILHIGCGDSPLPTYLSHCDEVRLDIDPAVKPDIVADMAHIPVGIGPFDAVFSCHSLEHLYPHDGESCLEGCLRELRPGGSMIIFVPDLEGISPTEDVLYHASGGDVRAADLFYGWRRMLDTCPYMAHRNGFVSKTLRALLEHVGFVNVDVKRMTDPYPYNLFAHATKPEVSDGQEGEGRDLHAGVSGAPASANAGSDQERSSVP